MKFLIPRDPDFKYENHAAVSEILTMANKYNWSDEEKNTMGTIIGKIRRAGYINCFNSMSKELKKQELINGIEDLTKNHYGKGMKDALLRAFSIGCRVSIYRDLNMCYIELTHDRTLNQRGQYLPIDGHLDRAIPGCIDICVRELLKDVDQKEVTR